MTTAESRTSGDTSGEKSLRAPGPKGSFILGSVLEGWRDPLGLMSRSRAEFGDIVRFRFGPFTYYFINDPDVVKHVLVDNAKAYTKSRNYQGLKLVLGEGLLTSEGDFWRRQRKLAQPAFHKESMEGFARDMASCTRAMLDRWSREDSATSSPETRAFCIHQEMMHLTFRIVGLTLMSTDVEGDAKNVGDALTFAMHYANDYAESIVRFPPWLPTPKNLKFARSMKTLDALVFRVIEERRKLGEHGPRDLLGLLMAAVDDDEHDGMTNTQLRDEMLTLVLAGHETTANLLAWTFMMLSKNPDVVGKLQQEANDVLGDRDPALADVPKLTYTKMVLEEALRLYPPAWAFERQATAVDYLGPYRIEPGSIVGISPYILHRHPKFWDDAEKFDPLRFSPEKSASRQRYTYLPFGGGPRTCIGNHFAMMEAQIILAMMAREQRIAIVPSHPIVLDPRITLRPLHGIQVTREKVRPKKSRARETDSAAPPP